MGRIITKTGDKGMTAIFGGMRVPKDDIRIEANGTMDELNAHLGVARTLVSEDDPFYLVLGTLQMRIMIAMSLIATPSHRRTENPNKFDPQWVKEIEDIAHDLMSKTEDNGWFILPGGTKLSAQLQLARTVCRRAERRLYSLDKVDTLPEGVLAWVNRMSDLLFCMAKIEMQDQNWPAEKWQEFSYKRKKQRS